MTSMSRQQFLEQYEYDADKEFEYDGKAAEWAPSTHGGPQMFEQGSNKLQLVEKSLGFAQLPKSMTMALSIDQRFLAVGVDAVIRIYCTESWQLISELVGHQGQVSRLVFLPVTVSNLRGKSMLLLSDVEPYSNPEIIKWQLDSGGRLMSRIMPFAIEHLADQAMGAISEDLTSRHDLDNEGFAKLRKSFIGSLKEVDTRNRVRDLVTVKGSFPNYKSQIADVETFRIMNLVREDSQIVIRSLPDLTEICHLSGHTDTITWASWSPIDDDIIASASLDGTYRIWDAHSGTCKHIISFANCQNWVGAFAPDGRHILLSGTNNVGVYSVTTGKRVANLEREGLKLRDWIREIDWSPNGDAVALGQGSSVWLWEPFAEDKLTEVFKFAPPKQPIMSVFMHMQAVQWLDGAGRKLAIWTGDGSYLVWDREKGLKWRFQRPRGLADAVSYALPWCYVEKTDTLLTLCDDHVIVGWKLS